MKPLFTLFLALSIPAAFADHHLEKKAAASDGETGFVSLFDGKTFDGWKVSETPSTAKIVDGAIVTQGERAHVFYTGSVNGAKFDNFELRLKVRTGPKANGGVYIHTEYQEVGWPSKGYEIQVNNSHSDWRKTGGLYAIVDVKEDVNKASDNEWMDYRILVKDQTITIWIDGVQTVKYTEEAGVERDEKLSGRLLIPGGGTIALQGHDPGSKVEYKDIRIKPLD